MKKEFRVSDASLAPGGMTSIEWAERSMPVLLYLRHQFVETKPFKNMRIGACLHVTKETGVLVRTLIAGGSEVILAASNPLSTQDEVAAALVEEGAEVFAWRGETEEEYWWAIDRVIARDPHITIDDGGDLTTRIHEIRTGEPIRVIGGTEETTTGIIRLRAMETSGKLRYPIIAVNNAETKWDFDNVYGTGQSSIDGILRATNVLLAGKRLVVAGYGHCGRGISVRARGMGANVIVTEVDPIRALRALMDGFEVMTMTEAATLGDIFVTATGVKDVIRGEHMKMMKNGAMLANSGHFNVEIRIPDLDSLTVSKREVRRGVEERVFDDGRKIYLLAQGRLVNLACAEGHPSEVMDMSFSNQALAVQHLIINLGRLGPMIFDVPKQIDATVARLKLVALGIAIDQLSEEQEKYLRSFGSDT